MGTLAWIGALNLTVAHAWTPWFVDGQVAGLVFFFPSKSQISLFYF